MSNYRTLGAAALTLVAVAAVVVLQHSATRPARSAANPTEPASVASSSPTSSELAPASTVAASPPALTQAFRSATYGLSIRYPAGWKATAGHSLWTLDSGEYREPLGDLVEDPTHEFLWLKLASQPLGSMPFDEWSATVFAGHGCEGFPLPLEVDGVKGLIDGACHTALVASKGRGYLIAAHLCPCELGSLEQWGAWFNGVVAAVQLEPDRAVLSK
jgi:hypothetical protein